MVRPPNPAMAMAATAALAIVRRDGAGDSCWSRSLVSSTPGCVTLVSLRSHSLALRACHAVGEDSSCSRTRDAGRRALSRWRRCGIGPRGHLPRVCVVAHRSTTDLRRGLPSDLSPCPHPTLVGGDTRLATAREGRPGDGSGVSGAVSYVSFRMARSMHRGASKPHWAECPGSRGSFRTFLGWTQQQAPEAPVFV